MISESLLKVLTGAGVGSRRWVTAAMKQGKVSVNGQVVEDFRYQLDLEKDKVTVDGKPVRLKAERFTLMLNKPAGIISTTSDERGRRTVIDILPGEYRKVRLYPIGRLDKDSTGLLLLTNDGDLAYQLTHPKFEYEKEYLVHIDGVLPPGEKRLLEHGVDLEDGITAPAVVKEVKTTPPFNYSIAIHEGRKRQVRRMLGSMGHPTQALRRVRMGNLVLGNLREGEVRKLSLTEIRKLLEKH